MTSGATPDPLARLLDRNIKDIIREHEGTGAILEQAGIGCVACSVGTCRLRDIVGIHGLTEEQETRLFARIAGVVFPGQHVAIPRLERRAPVVSGPVRFSPPMKGLVEEHTVIKRAIAMIAPISGRIGTLGEHERGLVRAFVEFVREFADRYHHAKEEDILFTYFDPDSDIIKAMRSEHTSGREHMRATLEALDRGDAAEVVRRLAAYGELLTEHIRKEDEILYPWMDRDLTDSQVGQLYARFQEVDRRFGDRPAHYRGWVTGLEAELGTEARGNQATTNRKDGLR